MTIKPEKDYKSISTRVQQKLLDSIPTQWRISKDFQAQNKGDARALIVKCDILSQQQLAITRLNASEVLKRIHGGELKAAEVVEAFCIRAAIAHQLVNCLTDFFPEEAIEQAKALDDEYSRTGKLVGPLHGMPMAVKDIMHVKGKVVTMAWVAWADNAPSTFDASPARVMRDAGAIFFGRTTMPQTGMALETVSNLFGRTLNPFNSAFGSGMISISGLVACPIHWLMMLFCF